MEQLYYRLRQEASAMSTITISPVPAGLSMGRPRAARRPARGAGQSRNQASQARQAAQATTQARQAAQPSRTGLTRRGWAVLGALLVLAMALTFRLGGLTGQQTAYVPTDLVAVQPGDSLWSLAQQSTPAGQDVRDTVAVIRELNGMKGSMVRAGDTLWVPRVSP
jgi:Tfp pilus assembly protein FimV